jgi:hypothetical protein
LITRLCFEMKCRIPLLQDRRKTEEKNNATCQI